MSRAAGTERLHGAGRAVAAALLVACLLLPVVSAAAHGGIGVIEQRDQSYNVTLLASERTGETGPVVDLTAYLIGQRLGEPDLDARVTITVDHDGNLTEHRAPVAGDGYEVVLAEGERGEWRDWGFTVDALGRAGHSRASSAPVRDSYSPPGWLLPSVGVLAAACLAWVATRRRRLGAY